MTKKERILKKIAADKELQKQKMKLSYYTDENFYKDAVRYASAIKQGRIICNIDSVSSSGMSRTIKFLECARVQKPHDRKTRYVYLNFFCFFTMLGWQQVREKHVFRIHGCGMDMIFHTNYTNIWKLYRLGFISRKQCDSLAQNTPTVI